MDDPILERIQREVGIPDLIDVLTERLSPTDLKSLLLEVYRRRTIKMKPSQLLGQFERDRLLISGLGTERFCSEFSTPPARAD